MTESAEHAAFLPVPAAQTCCPPARSRASDPHRIKISPRTKIHSPAAPGSYKKAPSRVPFCLGKMVRSDRLECGRKSGVKETAWSTTQLQPSAWWEGRSVQIGKGVPDNPQKVSSAARVLAAKHPKQAGLFAEKEAGRSGMRKARSRTGLFEWSAVHSDVG